jgi:hypothetical protein
MLMMGLLGLIMTPRQEDPQISVPMIDIMVQYPGASAQQVANMAMQPLERMMSEIPGVKHVYSASQRGQGIVTVEFEVGEEMGPSLVKVNDKVASNMDKIPPGVMPPLIKTKGIDDVPIVTLTLWSKDLDGDGIPDVDDGQLRLLAQDVLQAVKQVKDTGNAFIVGGRREVGHRRRPARAAVRISDQSRSGGADPDQRQRRAGRRRSGGERGTLLGDDRRLPDRCRGHQPSGGRHLQQPARLHLRCGARHPGSRGRLRAGRLLHGAGRRDPRTWPTAARR